MKRMQYKIIILLVILLYIYSGSVREYINTSDELYVREIQKEIIIDKKDINVFNKKKLDDVSITESRIKIWSIIIDYNDSNHDYIRNKLLSSGYQTKHNENKMYYSLGPFSDMSHAKEESKKLNKIYGLKNKIIDLSF